MDNPNKKPELLMPTGRPDAFYAALEGGADAVYLGLNRFNARARAKNFSIAQLPALLRLAHQARVKVYLTLNTVIKNSEILELVKLLHALSRTDVDAVIIQDWGVYHLIRKHFPTLVLHASTQMGNHNSAGTTFSKRMGFERVILARELTRTELRTIREKSDIGLELFAHGALCYSFSGMCLMSGYLGGRSANRGLCAQPCRREYRAGSEQKFLFSLKDNQLIERIPDLIHLGVDALKIEGRMKSAEYVYTVARAYRLALDHPDRIEEAKKILDEDLGREKTEYFFGGRIGKALTDTPTTGLWLGTVDRVTPDGFTFDASYPLDAGCRIRIQDRTGGTPETITLTEIRRDDRGAIRIDCQGMRVRSGDDVFLAGKKERKWSSRLPNSPKLNVPPLTGSALRNVLSGVAIREKSVREGVFIRIDSVDWLRFIPPENVAGLILSLPKREWRKLDQTFAPLRKYREKMWIALPKFISEGQLEFWTRLCRESAAHGLNRFMISHLSQSELLPKDAIAGTSENVYLFNDAAVSLVRSRNIDAWIYPFENDMENLMKGKSRAGIVPLYFYPELFVSRMPVVDWKPESLMTDGRNDRYRKTVRDGVTTILPSRPVALFQYRERLLRAGFRRFLIDLSFESPSQNRLQTVLKHFHASAPLHPSTSFNFRRGLE